MECDKAHDCARLIAGTTALILKTSIFRWGSFSLAGAGRSKSKQYATRSGLEIGCSVIPWGGNKRGRGHRLPQGSLRRASPSETQQNTAARGNAAAVCLARCTPVKNTTVWALDLTRVVLHRRMCLRIPCLPMVT